MQAFAQENMPDTGLSAQEIIAQRVFYDEKAPLKALPEEPVMWHNRFMRYVNLGPKRTMKAAVAQERSHLRALESTKVPEKGKGKRNAKTPAPVSPAKPKPLQVPGSWKQASIHWRWVDRARSFDTILVKAMVKVNLEHFYARDLANSAGRVLALQSLYDTLSKTMGKEGSRYSWGEMNVLYARLQSIIRDIREEMRIFDEEHTRDALAYRMKNYIGEHLKYPDYNHLGL